MVLNFVEMLWFLDYRLLDEARLSLWRILLWYTIMFVIFVCVTEHQHSAVYFAPLHVRIPFSVTPILPSAAFHFLIHAVVIVYHWLPGIYWYSARHNKKAVVLNRAEWDKLFMIQFKNINVQYLFFFLFALKLLIRPHCWSGKKKKKNPANVYLSNSRTVSTNSTVKAAS